MNVPYLQRFKPGQRVPSRKAPILLSLAFCLSLTLGSGCSSVNPTPFRQYAESVRQTRTGIDAALSTGEQWTREGFVESFANNPTADASDLWIQLEEDYNWKWEKAPVYISIRDTRMALNRLNNAFVDYASLLNQLASKELVSTATFDQMTRDLNNNLVSAAHSLNLTGNDQALALFSTAAVEAARLFIEHHRQHDLKKALNANQAAVERYSIHCSTLIDTLRGATKVYYSKRANILTSHWAEPAKRPKITAGMLDLNEEFITTLAILQELQRAYGTLPKAHADLAGGMGQKGSSWEQIQELYSSGKRLQRLYAELSKTNISIAP